MVNSITMVRVYYTLLYIRTSKLKPKLTRLKSGSFLLIEIIKFRFRFDLVFVKRDLFCTKNEQNKSESKEFLCIFANRMSRMVRMNKSDCKI